MFKLSFCHISRLHRGRYFPSLFVFISPHLVFIAQAMCAWLNVTVAVYVSVQQQCHQSRERDVAGREVLFLMVPKCTHNLEI